jgi:hypothetical protein
MPVEVQAAFEALESNGRMKLMGEILEKMKAIGLNEFPLAFIDWITKDTMTTIKNRLEGEHFMNMIHDTKASDAA